MANKKVCCGQAAWPLRQPAQERLGLPASHVADGRTASNPACLDKVIFCTSLESQSQETVIHSIPLERRTQERMIAAQRHEKPLDMITKYAWSCTM